MNFRLRRRPKPPPEPAPRTDPGDWMGPVGFTYAPHPDGLADPGEVVWGWVPFEDDRRRGKDRPVLVVARHGEFLLGLMLTSKDHARDLPYETSQNRHWLDVGTGDWDRERRPSEVRLDRVLQLRPDEVRREGAALSREMFERVGKAFTALRHN